MKNELLKDAYAFLAGIPANRFAVEQKTCKRIGRTACEIGWLALANKGCRMKRELLKDAYAILAGIPANRFAEELKFLVEQKTCKRMSRITCSTLACGIGWLALAKFEGLSLKSEDSSHHLTLNGISMHYAIAAQAVFAIDSKEAEDIFNPRKGERHASSRYDSERGVKILSDKALLLYRIRRTLGQSCEIARAAATKDAA